MGAFKEVATICALSGIGVDERDRTNRKGVNLLGSGKRQERWKHAIRVKHSLDALEGGQND